MRIHEYAKKFGVESKQIIDVLEKNGVAGKKVSNSINTAEEKILDSVFAGSSGVNAAAGGFAKNDRADNAAGGKNQQSVKATADDKTQTHPGMPVRRVTIGLDTKHRYDSRKILEINARLSKAHEQHATASTQHKNMTREQREWLERKERDGQNSARQVNERPVQERKEPVPPKKGEVPAQQHQNEPAFAGEVKVNNVAVSAPVSASREENKSATLEAAVAESANTTIDSGVSVSPVIAEQPGAVNKSAKDSAPENKQTPATTTAPSSGNSQQQQRPGYQQGQRPPYQQNQQRQGYQQGQRPPYQQDQQRQGFQQGQRPPYQQNQQRQGYQQGQRPPYQQDQQRQGYQQGQRPPYQQDQQRQGYQQGQRPPYQQDQQRQGFQQGQRPPYQQDQQRQGYQQGQRPPYQQNQQRPGFQQGQRPPYQQNQQRPGFQQGQRPPYQQNQRPGFQQGQRGNSAFDKDKDGGSGSNFRQQGGQAKKPVKAALPDAIQAKNTKKNTVIDKNKKFGEKRDKRTENAAALDKHYRGRPTKQIVAPVQKIDTRPKNVKILGSIAVNEFASKLGVTSSQIIMKLMKHGIMATLNQEIDIETAMVIGEEFGVTVEELPPEADPTEIVEIEDNPEDLVTRPPVVTVMGHVDHGKTSLLDAIRSTRVVAGEAGGITQHIGAYQVTCHGKKIAFLDTPGHEAFTAMRARGAQATDIAILVVAADDGVMPQTIEAINHAKAAKVPVIVAINKMDKDGANPERVKQQLTEYGLQAEDWGGDTIMVPVSAHKRTGINELLEMILLVAEMNDLKANPNRAAQGIVIEAQLDKGRGPVATVLVQKGTLHTGDTVIVGATFGNVRAMFNDKGEKIKKAGPSVPVEILGLNSVPEAGDVMLCVEERIARSVAEKRLSKKKLDEQRATAKVSLDELFKQIKEGNLKDLNIVVKADVQGSVEALRQSLLKITNDEVRVNVIHAAAGAITESDVNLAAAANALIIGFNVRPDSNARKAAEDKDVDIRLYRVIYDAINDVETAMKGMLAPEFKEVVQGKVEIRKVYNTSKGIFAGCYVLEGKVTNQSSVRLLRDNIVLHEGKIDSLRRFKDDVKEVATGYECGIVLAKFREIRESDVLEVFIMEEIAR